jgi:type I restriction system adenine methylase HsdM
MTAAHDIELALWRAADVLRHLLAPALLGECLRALCFLKYVSAVGRDHAGGAPSPLAVPREGDFEFLLENCGTRGNAARIKAALAALESANPEKLRKRFAELELDVSEDHEHGAYNEALANVIRILSSGIMDPGPGRNGELEASEAFGFLLSAFPTGRSSNASEFHTPTEVAQLMAQLVDARPGISIYDPTCGSGGLLLECAHLLRDRYDSREYTLYGQEINPSSWRGAVMNACLHGEDASRIECGDTLREPLHVRGNVLQRFDAIVAHPPFSMGYSQWETIGEDRFGRFARGVPPRARLDYAFILHMIESMNPDSGRVVTLAPHGVLFRGGAEGEIRRNLIDTNLLDAVIGLPPKLFYGSAIPAVILCFRAKRQDEDVLFIDASRDFAAGRKRNALREQDIERIISTLAQRSSIPAYARLVSRREIADGGFSLNIARYVGSAAKHARANLQALAQRQWELEAELGTVRRRIESLLQQLVVEDVPPGPRDADQRFVKPTLSLPVREFCRSIKVNRLFSDLESAYVQSTGRNPSVAKRDAWTHGLPRLSGVLELCDLPESVYVGLEVQVPYYSKRVDLVLYGHEAEGRPSMMLVELKQWSELDSAAEDGRLSVRMRTGLVPVVHPSLQVQGYRRHLANVVRAFQNEPRVQLSGCVYAYNYTGPPGPLSDAQYSAALAEAPLFCATDAERLAGFIKARLCRGRGAEVIDRIRREGLAPSQLFIEKASELTVRQDVFTLLDEQIPAQRSILAALGRAIRTKRKSIILVEAGPGTGKSVIALDALGHALGKKRSAFLVSGSAAFTHGMRRLLGSKRASLVQFTDFFWKHAENSVDVLIVDEAHRIRARSTPRVVAAQRPKISQLEELVRAARVTVLFMDTNQIIEPDEVGDPQQVEALAQRLRIKLDRHQLKSQFRCDGSDEYLRWTDELFGLTSGEEIRTLRSPRTFDFGVMESPHEVLRWVRERNSVEPHSARLTAGWCWPWSDPGADGTLVNDIVIEDFAFPWELKNGRRGKPGVPEAKHWAVDPAGAEQAGTVYSVQGFEFRHVGVLMGPDLVIRDGRWVANPTANFRNSIRGKSSEVASVYLRRIYRALFTRALRGARVFSVDAETRAFIRSKLASTSGEVCRPTPAEAVAEAGLGERGAGHERQRCPATCDM